MGYPQFGKPLAVMTEEVRKLNTDKGWRSGDNTFGDYVALLHSEVSEMLEAYRDHRLADAIGPAEPIWGGEDRMGNPIRRDWQPGKPEGVGSEMADVLIRLIDMADVYHIDLAQEYERKMAYNRTRPYQHGGRTISEPIRADVAP
jgi:NTP pyrophosphatase (non-canonical NTP hydrolase)